jgi:hypothetical protein
LEKTREEKDRERKREGERECISEYEREEPGP